MMNLDKSPTLTKCLTSRERLALVTLVMSSKSGLESTEDTMQSKSREKHLKESQTEIGSYKRWQNMNNYLNILILWSFLKHGKRNRGCTFR